MMKSILLTATCLLFGSAALHQAHAQKEAVGMFYEIQMAPKVCKWTNVADSKKLDAMIKDQEKAFGITAADRAELMKKAEEDLKSDPSNCASDGMLRPMYDEAVK